MLKNLFLMIPILFAFQLLTIPTSQAVPFEGSKILISCQSPYAVEAGKKIAELGGNVVDVAVTVALVESVTSPYFAGLGGGGFALVKINNERNVLDFRETAPEKTHEQFYIDKPAKSSQNGGMAVGVPGIPAGMKALHKKYGKLKWHRLFKYAITIANKGFNVSGEWVKRTQRTEKRFNDAGLKAFFKNKNIPYKPGETLKQKALGKVLKKLSRKGPKAFYTGSVAQDIVNTIRDNGGVMTLNDLKNYKVRWLQPIKMQFRGHDIYLMPPPSSGGIVIASALKLVDKIKLDRHEPFSGKELHHIAEVLSRSFRGRTLLGDPDFHKNPIEDLLSDKYLDKMAQSIRSGATTKLKPLTKAILKKESSETTHISVLDNKGNAVSMTITMNGNYGSGVVTKKFGLALNNEMDDFTTLPGKPNLYGLIQGEGNFVQAGKRPLSSMSPTLVEKNGRVILAIGSPGGPKIISSVFQGLYRTLVTKLDLDRALQAPRVHHQYLPHKIFVEKDFLPSQGALRYLKKRNHTIATHKWWARLYAVKLRDDGILEAAFDSRGEGAAGGL